MEASTQIAARLDVPGNAFAGDVPLVAVERGEYVGSLHRGTLAVVDTRGRTVLALGDITQPAFLRSSAKPFQVMPAILSGGVDRFNLTTRELAVLCASHHAEPRHMEAVLAVLGKIGLPEDALHCGIHPPIHETTALAMAREGRPPTPVCNNCSGAHAGMLVACRALGEPIEDYGNPDHPVQRWIRRILATFAGLEAEDVTMATDNCDVPTFRLPVGNAAMAFARLADATEVPNDLRTASSRVVQAMTTYPEMIAGEDSFDSDLMAAAEGAVVSKGGAEGFQGIGCPGKSLGLAMKISDGNSRAVPPAALRVLDELGVIPGAQRARLDNYARPELHNYRGEHVGRLVPVFACGTTA